MRQVEPFGLELTEDTLFDLASLSKLAATTLVALKFIDEGKIGLDDGIGKFLDFTGNFGDCRIFHLLTHSSGMLPGIPLFDLPSPENALSAILTSSKASKAGKKVSYSCLGYITLGKILELVGGESLDVLAKKYVFAPLEMSSACYNPDKNLPVAATEKYAASGEFATGRVHDENTRFLGGVSGNAGVFASLDDVISLAGMLSARGRTKNGTQYLSEELFDLAIRNHTPFSDDARGLGFQLKGESDFPMGALLSRGSYGHTGFTGTSLYVDSQTGVWGVLLTNAVHLGRENRGPYFELRKAFYDSLVSEY